MGAGRRRSIGGVIVGLFCAFSAMARAGERSDAEAAALDEAAIEAAFDEAALDAAFDFDALDDLGLGDEFALLAQEDIVVSAARRAQHIDDSPSAITVLTRKDLLASPYDNVADVLRTVPGMDVFLLTIAYPATGTRSGTSIAGSNVLVLIDGRDVLNPLFQLPLWLGLPVDLASIERIEVIRGPASTLYGANALQGVINIVTRRAADGPLQVEASISGASLSTFAGDLRLHGTVGRLSYWSALGYESRAAYHSPDEIGAWALRGRSWLRYEGEDVEGILELGGGIQEGDIVTFAGNGSGKFQGLYLRAEAIVYETRIRLFADQLHGAFNLDLNLRFPTDPAVVLAQLPQPMEHPTRAYELSAERAWRLTDDLRILGGLTGKIIHHRAGSMVTCAESLPTAFDPTTCEPNELLEGRIEGFGQLEWRLLPSLDLNLGLRTGLNTLVSEPGFSPRLSAVYRPAKHHTVRASVARAYRKPSFFELQGHVLLEPGTLQDQDLLRRLQYLFAAGIGEESLRNTKVDIAELGWRGRFLEDALRVEVELYVSRYLDDVRVDGSSLQEVQYFAGLPIIDDSVEVIYRNVPDDTWSVGAELAATWSITEELELNLVYGLDHVRRSELLPDGSRTSNKDYREPEHHLMLGGRYGGKHLRIGVDALWTSAFRGFHTAAESILAPQVATEVGGNTLLTGRVGWAFDLGGSQLEAGLYGHLPVLGLELRETSGEILADGSNYAGHPIRPRLQGYLRASF